MEIFNSKDLAEDVEGLKQQIKNLEKIVTKLETKIISLEYSCDTNSNEIEAINATVDDLHPDISEVEYPK